MLQMPEGSQLIANREEVMAAVERLAAKLNEAYADTEVLALVVMNGAMIPASWILTRLKFPVMIDYMHVTRYRGSTEGMELYWIAHPRHELRDRHVLVIDDILDEGPTLGAVLDHCRQAGTLSVRCAVLAEKIHDRRAEGVAADFVGLQVPDKYVFGCGMDYAENLRHLDEIWALP